MVWVIHEGVIWYGRPMRVSYDSCHKPSAPPTPATPIRHPQPTFVWPEGAVAVQVDLEVAEEGELHQLCQQREQVVLVQALHRCVVAPTVGDLGGGGHASI